MRQLILFFASTPILELNEIHFTHSDLSVSLRRCVRGKVAKDCSGTFQWSRAIQGFSRLVLQTCLYSSSVAEGTLQGEAKSLASALDYAVARNSAWACDVFGTDIRGSSNLSRLLIRTNPERKRSGPVVLRFDSRYLSRTDIVIILDGRLISDPGIVSRLANQLSVFDEEVTRAAPSTVTEHAVMQLAVKEVSRSLADTSIFSPARFKTFMRSLIGDVTLQRYAGKSLYRLAAIDTDLKHSAWRGSSGSSTALGLPLQVAVPLGNFTSAVLMSSCPAEYGVSFSVNTAFLHGAEIVELLKSRSIEPDLVGLGLGAAALLLRDPSLEYTPIMLFPKTSHAIISTPGARKNVGMGSYCFCSEDLTSALYCFDELIRERKLSRKKISVVDTHPFDLADALSNAEHAVHSISWFPNYALLAHRLSLDISQAHGNSSLWWQPSILFAHNRVIADLQLTLAIRMALRRRWKELQNDHDNQLRALDTFMISQNVVDYLESSCGFETGVAV